VHFLPQPDVIGVLAKDIVSFGVVQIAWIAELRLIGQVECLYPELQLR
jgi:hypothetical protein